MTQSLPADTETLAVAVQQCTACFESPVQEQAGKKKQLNLSVATV